ncbi:MAG: DNA-processing protein DprA [Fibrobacter sp.]|nr:DNA-processing protein DprA [Fibrobacter sp.]
MKDEKIHRIPAGNFPLLLNASTYKPEFIYVKGSLPPPTQPAATDSAALNRRDSPVGIAMVGTRRPSNSARELCKRLVFSLKGTQAIVVSGLAQGIDCLCHEAALEAGITTIAVLGQGLDTKIEGSRGDLAQKILDAGGALVSQFEPDEPAYKGNFIARNKIISGMCAATLIVQSKAKGGALLTGEFTRKEGKPLYTIPGDFDNEVASGPNELLDKGYAKPVFRPESLCNVLGLPKKGGLSLGELSRTGCQLDSATETFFRKVNGYRKTFSELQAESGLEVAQLLTILTELEMAGLVHTEDNFNFHFNGAT